MLQKHKITTYVFILCLFGLTLMTTTPVFAYGKYNAEFEQCEKIEIKNKQGNPTGKRMNCFRNLAYQIIKIDLPNDKRAKKARRAKEKTAEADRCALNEATNTKYESQEKLRREIQELTESVRTKEANLIKQSKRNEEHYAYLENKHGLAVAEYVEEIAYHKEHRNKISGCGNN